MINGVQKMMHLKKILAGAMLVAGLATTSANALTSISFTTVVTAGENSLDFMANPAFNGATGTGSITYDETLMLTEYAAPDLTMTLTMFGQTFTETDDEVASAVYDPSTGDLFFSVSEFGLLNAVAIDLAGLDGFSFSSPITPLLGGGNEVTVFAFVGDGTCNSAGCALTPVPLPATLPILLSALGLVGWTARRAS